MQPFPAFSFVKSEGPRRDKNETGMSFSNPVFESPLGRDNAPLRRASLGGSSLTTKINEMKAPQILSLMTLAVILWLAPRARAQMLTTLHSFSAGNDGAGPRAGLIQAVDGSFYGTTYGSTPSGFVGYGTIFKITRTGS